MSNAVSQYKQGLVDGYDYAMHVMQAFIDSDNALLQEIGSVSLASLRNVRDGFIASAVAMKEIEEINNG